MLFALNRLRWYFRFPLKCTIIGLTVLLVCFPYPQRLIRHVQHIWNPNALIDPDAPGLQPLADELRVRLTPDLTPRAALRTVERYVYEKVPYDWDWNTWGTADYLPTVEEVIGMGREDCDGRAVLAASLLRHFGFRAHLVSDLAHLWVMTDVGEAMGPGKTKAVVATDKGVRFNASALRELPKAAAYGIAVFPLGRELIVVAVVWLLMLRQYGGVLCGLAGGAMLLVGLGFIRAGSKEYLQPTLWMQWVAVVSWIAGLAILLLWASRNARRAERARLCVA